MRRGYLGSTVGETVDDQGRVAPGNWRPGGKELDRDSQEAQGLTSRNRTHRIPWGTQDAYGKGRASGRHSRVSGRQKFFADVMNGWKELWMNTSSTCSKTRPPS